MLTRSAAAALTLASGAHAFLAPMPSSSLRFSGVSPVLPGSAAARASAHRVVPHPRLSNLAMNKDSSMGLNQHMLAVPAAPTTSRENISGSSFGKNVGKLAMILSVVMVSTLMFVDPSSAAAWGAKAVAAPPPPVHWINDAKFWGFLGAIAGWGMSLAAIKDAATSGPEIISENMTVVMLIYSFLFAWWAWVVTPQNLLLCACHGANILAQANQARRLIGYKLASGGAQAAKDVNDMAYKALGAAYVASLCIFGGPLMQGAVASAGWGGLSAFAASKAGPFTVHFWAPMSKWLISGASFLDLKRPTDKISVAQYSALTMTGFFFTRYALLVQPVNYVLCSVNIALFCSSAWQLGRKIKADYFSGAGKLSSASSSKASSSSSSWTPSFPSDASSEDPAAVLARVNSMMASKGVKVSAAQSSSKSASPTAPPLATGEREDPSTVLARVNAMMASGDVTWRKRA